MPVQNDKRRVKEQADTELVSPHGTKITVTKSRAEALLAREPIRLGDGVARRYARPGDSNEVAPVVSKAAPPRVGNRANTTDGE